MRIVNLLSSYFLLGTFCLAQFIAGATGRSPSAHGGQSKSSLKAPLVIVDAEARSAKDGLAVSNLDHRDLLIWENDTPEPIFSFEALRARLSILIAVDATSASARGPSATERVNSLELALANALGPDDEVCVVSISGRPELLQDYTNDMGLVGSALQKASHRTYGRSLPLDQRLNLILKVASQRQDRGNPAARNVLLVVSDLPKGTPGGEMLPAGILRNMAESKAVLCWSNSRPFAAASRGEALPLVSLSLSSLVSLSGGEPVTGDWSSFIDELRRIYRISYLVDNRGRSGQLVRIGLGIRPNGKLDPADIALVYPRVAIVPKEE